MCRKCEIEVDKEFEAAQAVIRERAAKRKCRSCQAPLVPERYLHCFDCVKPGEWADDSVEHEINAGNFSQALNRGIQIRRAD